MRVTNNMAATQALNNIWRNSRHVNGIVQSIETGKRIQRPSDNPLLSGRVLRYRTLLSEAEQFIRNAHTGMSWMDVSEAAFDNLLTGNNSIVARVNDAVLRAADGTTELDNVRAITDEIRQLFEQLKFVEMNQTYMGRFVFSGFHTDQPPVLTEAMTDRLFVMQHTFNIRDIESVTTFHRPAPNEPLDLPEASIIKLPFAGNISFGALAPPVPAAANVPPVGIWDGATPPNQLFDIVEVSIDDPNAYRPPAGGVPPVIHFVRESGELVLSDDAKDAWADGTVITFHNGDMPPGATATAPQDLNRGDLNPIINFRSWDITDRADVRPFDAPSQKFELEIASNSRVQINSHASNILTPQMYADFRNLIRFIDSIEPSDPTSVRAHFQNPPYNKTGEDLENHVSRFLSDEAGAIADMIHIRFNNMIELNLHHAGRAQAEHADLGSRMARLEMLQIRLEDDEIAYTGLLSDAEDTDIPAAIMLRNNAETAMQNALRAIAATTQLSLADFINR